MTEEDQDSRDPDAPKPPDTATQSAESAESVAPAAPSESATLSESAAPAATRKKSKKGRRKKRAVEGASRPELDADGRERPVFLLSFPHDPELERLITAFEVGNYALVRASALQLAERSESPEVKAAARELLARIEPDPLVKFLLAVAIALFVAVVLLVYHSHG
jgi:hypothetical protein